MRSDPRGSSWRRWDLHFHTFASFDYENGGVKAEDLVGGLIDAGIEVVAVTDHHVIDEKLIHEMQGLAANRLTVLPGIELRSQLGGSESVHYIGIFDEDCDLDDIWTKLQSLGISYADVKKKRDEKVFVQFEKGCKKIRELGGIVTVHAGGKSNTIEGLSNADILKQAVKTDYVHQYLHAFEVGKVSDCDGYSEKVFPTIKKRLPLLLCSDNHNINEYKPKCSMWIKADPCFGGLLQLLNEPSSRIFLGDIPLSLEREAKNKTRYMTSISFERTKMAIPNEKWFSGSIPLNHGLIAIIGNKGSGKSALADILALLGDTHITEQFSFLNRDRFLVPKTKLGDMFQAKVTWHSGKEIPKLLSGDVDLNSPELVKYIPQQYLEKICSELKEPGEGQFYRELMGVIFSHVIEAEQLGMETLPDLIDYLTHEKEEWVTQILLELSDINRGIVGLENQLTKEYNKGLEAQLKQRHAELSSHDASKPIAVRVPDQDPQAQETTEAITAELKGLQLKAKELDKRVAEEREKQRRAAFQIAAADKLLARIENLKRQVDTFYEESNEDCRMLEIEAKDLAGLMVNPQPILDAKGKAEEIYRSIKILLNDETKDSYVSQRQKISLDMENKRLKLDEPNRRYQEYLHQLSEWQKKRDEITGSVEHSNSVEGLKSKLAALLELPTRLAKQYDLRKKLVRDIFEAKLQLLQSYRKLYSPVQEFIDKHPISKQNKALQFFASIIVDGFEDGLLDMIHQGKKGSFQGEQEGHTRLRSLESVSDFSNTDGVLTFLASIHENLVHDMREKGNPPIQLRDQLRQDVSVQKVYDFLYGLDYLKPRFELRWQGKPIDQLSAGERGNLLLVFYLLIDKRVIPLIIDQPEENLDNQTITSMLVPAIKEAKERRQIIIVTHNPNLAVVCDADQIIHTSLDKMCDNKVSYITGAIENPEITKLIIDVLEGTKPAFDLRDAKYDILEHRT